MDELGSRSKVTPRLNPRGNECRVKIKTPPGGSRYHKGHQGLDNRSFYGTFVVENMRSKNLRTGIFYSHKRF